MKKLIALFILFIAGDVFAQDYRKDTRSQLQKEDTYNEYQSELITNRDLLKALEFSGVRVFKFPIGSFNRKYKLTVKMDEYIDGKLVALKNMYLVGTNVYTHFAKATEADSVPVLYSDYIDQLSFFTRKNDDKTMSVLLETYAAGDGAKLTTKYKREFQFYMWRHYSNVGWVLNQDIPLLVFASSWYDKKYKVERFCGVVDLSVDEKLTKELLSSSPHYFVISYKVSDNQ